MKDEISLKVYKSITNMKELRKEKHLQLQYTDCVILRLEFSAHIQSESVDSH